MKSIIRNYKRYNKNTRHFLILFMYYFPIILWIEFQSTLTPADVIVTVAFGVILLMLVYLFDRESKHNYNLYQANLIYTIKGKK